MVGGEVLEGLVDHLVVFAIDEFLVAFSAAVFSTFLIIRSGHGTTPVLLRSPILLPMPPSVFVVPRSNIVLHLKILPLSRGQAPALKTAPSKHSIGSSIRSWRESIKVWFSSASTTLACAASSCRNVKLKHTTQRRVA